MMIKKKIWFRFQDCYVEVGEVNFNGKTFIKRGIYIALMITGIIITIAPFIDASQFLPPSRLNPVGGSYYLGDNLIFDPDVINCLVYLILPFVVGIWVTGWSIEDTGLMYYKLPRENEKILFEIEPLHLKYNGLIKGYAGVSSILFLVIATTVYLKEWPLHIFQVVATILVMMTLYSAPAYFIYLKVSQKVYRRIFRKDLQELEMLTKNDIKLK